MRAPLAAAASGENVRVRDQGAAPMSTVGAGGKLGPCLREEEKR
jgi:hypothetical protein